MCVETQMLDGVPSGHAGGTLVHDWLDTSDVSILCTCSHFPLLALLHVPSLRERGIKWYHFLCQSSRLVSLVRAQLHSKSFSLFSSHKNNRKLFYSWITFPFDFIFFKYKDTLVTFFKVKYLFPEGRCVRLCTSPWIFKALLWGLYFLIYLCSA